MKNNIFLGTFPPHNILAEELLIGIILLNLDNQITNEINDQINLDALILESHQIIYRTILYHNQDYKLNVIKLVQCLSEKSLLHKIGGLEKILELVNNTIVFQKVSNDQLSLNYYIEIIHNKYIRRLIIQWSTYIITLGLTESITLDLILKQACKYIERIFLLKKQKNIFSLSTILKDLVNNLNLSQETYKKYDTASLKCGLEVLDNITQGFQPSDLIIIAGRPAMGKTSIALNITNYVLQNIHQGVILFSFEMSKRQVLYRLLSIKCKIKVSELRNGSLNLLDLKNIRESCQAIAQSFFYIEDNPNTTIFELNVKSKKFAEKYITNLIVIDYLQLIQDSNLLFYNRVQELSSITRILKVLAREISVPLVVLSQLNRNVESRTNKRPLLSDLRESGCISSITKLRNNQQLLQVNKAVIYFISNTRSINSQRLLNISSLGKKFSRNLQYTYTINFHNYTRLYITNNHKLLTFSGWKKEDNLLIFDTIITKNNNLYLNIIKNTMLFYNSVLSIYSYTYNLVYDLKINKLLNFDTTKTIIHNSIEQDADLVLLLYREDYYNANNNPKKLTEIIIAKHRNGPTGSFELYFDPSYTIFTNA